MELIQVCADPSDRRALDREVEALEIAGRLHPRAIKRLLTLTSDVVPEDLPATVQAQPAYAWLLGSGGIGGNSRSTGRPENERYT